MNILSDGIQDTPSRMDSILLIGQSNMCGRGIIGEVSPIDHEKSIFMLRNGRWQPMSEPINPDRAVFVEKDTDFRSGVSLAASFAQDYYHTYGRKVGLIPCADGGSGIGMWQPGKVLFDHAVSEARFAMRSSAIRGILWHQGESDSKDMVNVEAYEELFYRMIHSLCEALFVEDSIPIIVGEITLLARNRFPYARNINEVLHRIASSNPRYGIARTTDLPLSSDGVHFSAHSLRALGRRYFEQYDLALKRISNQG